LTETVRLSAKVSASRRRCKVGTSSDQRNIPPELCVRNPMESKAHRFSSPLQEDRIVLYRAGWFISKAKPLSRRDKGFIIIYGGMANVQKGTHRPTVCRTGKGHRTILERQSNL